MSDPIPHLDPPPAEHPGGVDGTAVDEYGEGFPQQTPDPPVSAQIARDVVPDEVQEPEKKQQEGEDSGPEKGDAGSESSG
jgi:hypothetical protein